MSEQFEHKAHPSKVQEGLSHVDNESLPGQPTEQDLMALIRKMQQQLIFLEKKIDILISQSQGGSFRQKQYSKPFHTFDRAHRRPDRGYNNTSSERSFERGGHFEKRRTEENREFGHKRAYDNPRESDSGGRPHFEKRHGGENRGFHQRKKPFYYGRKDRG